eukprot:IDg13850t1
MTSILLEEQNNVRNRIGSTDCSQFCANSVGVDSMAVRTVCALHTRGAHIAQRAGRSCGTSKIRRVHVEGPRSLPMLLQSPNPGEDTFLLARIVQKYSCRRRLAASR